MNLIERQHDESIISYFRLFEYSKINYLLDLGMQYLIKAGLTVDPTVYSGPNSIEIIKDVAYSKIYHFACNTYRIKIENNKSIFIYISIPELINGTFFKLNSTYYIPILYITDEPIVIKEKSITIQSLFQPITLYFGESRVIFMGSNYVLSDFLNFITYDWDSELRKSIQELLNIQFNENLNSIISILANKLNCLQDYTIIKNKINDLFFDEYTKELHSRYYNISNIDGIIMTAMFKRYEQQVENKYYKFNDLRHKRLIFIEMLLKPYFKAISNCTNLLLHNKSIFNLKLKINEIIENFYTKLHGNCLYDTVNGFSGILMHKATFDNPYGSGELPKEVSSIHWTHKGRICPNSISNKKSGRDIFLVPNQNIDLDYGIFKFTEDEMKKPS